MSHKTYTLLLARKVEGKDLLRPRYNPPKVGQKT